MVIIFFITYFLSSSFFNYITTFFKLYSKLLGNLRWEEVIVLVTQLNAETKPGQTIILKKTSSFMYLGELKVLQYFGNLFALFFKLQQKQPSIQSRSHLAAPSEAK